jgi:hypothetical protein
MSILLLFETAQTTIFQTGDIDGYLFSSNCRILGREDGRVVFDSVLDLKDGVLKNHRC